MKVIVNNKDTLILIVAGHLREPHPGDTRGKHAATPRAIYASWN
jgi:hypothetical protein